MVYNIKQALALEQFKFLMDFLALCLLNRPGSMLSSLFPNKKFGCHTLIIYPIFAKGPCVVDLFSDSSVNSSKAGSWTSFVTSEQKENNCQRSSEQVQ